MNKAGSIDYVLDRIKLLDIRTVFPHEAGKKPEVYSIMAAMNRVDPNHLKRMNLIPITVRPNKYIKIQRNEYTIPSGISLLAASTRGFKCAYDIEQMKGRQNGGIAILG